MIVSFQDLWTWSMESNLSINKEWWLPDGQQNSDRSWRAVQFTLQNKVNIRGVMNFCGNVFEFWDHVLQICFFKKVFEKWPMLNSSIYYKSARDDTRHSLHESMLYFS